MTPLALVWTIKMMTWKLLDEHQVYREYLITTLSSKTSLIRKPKLAASSMHLTPSGMQGNELFIIHFLNWLSCLVSQPPNEYMQHVNSNTYINRTMHTEKESKSNNKYGQTSKTQQCRDEHHQPHVTQKFLRKKKKWGIEWILGVHFIVPLSPHNLYIPKSSSEPSISHLTAFFFKPEHIKKWTWSWSR